MKAVLEQGSEQTQKSCSSLKTRDAASIPDLGPSYLGDINQPKTPVRRDLPCGFALLNPQGSRWDRCRASSHRHSSPDTSQGML